jgi:hypothetical protein
VISADNVNDSNAPFARASEADRNGWPGYSWLPHLYQDKPRIKDRWNPVNLTLQAKMYCAIAMRLSDFAQRQARVVAVGPRVDSGVTGAGTPLMRDRLEKMFRIEQFTGGQRQFWPNLFGNLIRHAKAYVTRK